MRLDAGVSPNRATQSSLGQRPISANLRTGTRPPARETGAVVWPTASHPWNGEHWPQNFRDSPSADGRHPSTMARAVMGGWRRHLHLNVCDLLKGLSLTEGSLRETADLPELRSAPACIGIVGGLQCLLLRELGSADLF